MTYSFQAETIVYTLAAVGLAVLVRELWLWILGRAGRGGEAFPMLLVPGRRPQREQLQYIECACEEIRRRYFPGLRVCEYGGDQQEMWDDARSCQN